MKVDLEAALFSAAKVAVISGPIWPLEAACCHYERFEADPSFRTMYSQGFRTTAAAEKALDEGRLVWSEHPPRGA